MCPPLDAPIVLPLLPLVKDCVINTFNTSFVGIYGRPLCGGGSQLQWSFCLLSEEAGESRLAEYNNNCRSHDFLVSRQQITPGVE